MTKPSRQRPAGAATFYAASALFLLALPGAAPVQAQTVSVPGGGNIANAINFSRTPGGGTIWALAGDARLYDTDNTAAAHSDVALPATLVIRGNAGGSTITLNNGGTPPTQFGALAGTGTVTLDLSQGGPITFAGGSSAAAGGAVTLAASSVYNLNGEVKFINNYAPQTGGAINAAGNATINFSGGNTTFDTNLAGVSTNGLGAGGAINSAAGLTLNGGGNALAFVNNSTTAQNPTSGGGGAVFARNDIAVTGSYSSLSFDGNTAFGYGGAIGASGSVTINPTLDGDLNFTGNTTTGHDGGAIYAEYITIGAAASGALNITGNSAAIGNGHGGGFYAGEDITIKGSYAALNITGNRANYQGGALYAYPGAISISGTYGAGGINIKNNRSSDGGAAESATFTLNAQTTGALTISGNDATAGSGQGIGGAILANDLSNLGLSILGIYGGGIIITGNSADYGSALFSYMGPLTIDTSADSLLITSNTARTGYGALSANSSNIRISGTYGAIALDDNISPTDGALAIAAGNITIDASSNGAMSISRNNSSTGRGGALRANGAIAISGSHGGGAVINDNRAGVRGGAIYAGNGFSLTLPPNSSFSASGNKAQDNASGGFLYAAGGAMLFDIGAGATAAIGNATSATSQSDSIAAAAAVTLAKNGGGTLALNANNTYTGTTAVNAGTLAGVGTVGSTIINNGSTFQPGNGTAGSRMQVNGDLTFQSANATYLVNVTQTTSSMAKVSGTVALNGVAVDMRFTAQPNLSVGSEIVLLDASAGGTLNNLAGATLNVTGASGYVFGLKVANNQLIAFVQTNSNATSGSNAIPTLDPAHLAALALLLGLLALAVRRGNG